MAEIVSSLPSSGGPYFWYALLSSWKGRSQVKDGVQVEPC